MRSTLVLCALLAAGCPKRVDPAAADRLALAAIDEGRETPVSGPHLSLVVSDQGLDDLAGDFVSALLGTGFATDIATPLGMSLHIEVKAGRPDITVFPAPPCAGCVDVGGQVEGDAMVTIETFAGSTPYDVDWRAGARGGVSVHTERREQGTAIVLGPTDQRGWSVDAELQGMPEPFGSMGSAVLRQQLRSYLEQPPLNGPLDALVVPDGAVRLWGIGANSTPSLRLDAHFGVLKAGVVAEPPDPKDGFVIAVPLATALGLADAALLRQTEGSAYGARATSFSAADGRFVMGVRLQKVSRKPKWRDYEITGFYGLAEDKVIVRAEALDYKVGEGRWSKVTVGLAQSIAEKRLRKNIVEIPRHVEKDLGVGATFVVDIASFQVEGDSLVVRGKAHAVPSPVTKPLTDAAPAPQ